jgi:hypothetical protein
MSKAIRQSPKYQGARAIARRKVRGKKGSRTRKRNLQRRRVARSYVRVKNLQRQRLRGTLAPEARKLMRAYGLNRVNPSKGVKSDAKDFGMLLKAIALPGIGGFVGAAALGQLAGSKIVGTEWGQKMSPALQRAAFPVTTGAITFAAFWAMRKFKGGAIQRAAMPVAVGGIIATGLHILLHSKIGQTIASKLKLPVTLVHGTDAQAEQAAEDAAKVAAGQKDAGAQGVAGYLTVRQYLGAMGREFSPKGASWYGRSDISPMGDYVDAGPTEAFGSYVASDFPVHTPGPADNASVHAALSGAYPPGGYDGYGAWQDPDLPETPDYDLVETPGGTLLAGGIFNRRTAIG